MQKHNSKIFIVNTGEGKPMAKTEIKGNRKRTAAEKTIAKSGHNNLKSDFAKPVITQGYVCFHLISEPNRILSNWYSSSFELGGVRYSSAEQYFMHQKALIFGDLGTAKVLLSTNNPQKIKMYGRMVKNYNDKAWNGIRAVVLYEGLLAKFSQNEAARQFLLSTGDAVLCECAKNDLIWGNGMDMNDPDRLDMSKWRGESLLGFILMKVREKIK